MESLTVLDDSTVMAVSSIRGLGTDGIWTVLGRVRRDGSATLQGLAHRIGLEAGPHVPAWVAGGTAFDALGRIRPRRAFRPERLPLPP